MTDLYILPGLEREVANMNCRLYRHLRLTHVHQTLKNWPKLIGIGLNSNRLRLM